MQRLGKHPIIADLYLRQISSPYPNRFGTHIVGHLPRSSCQRNQWGTHLNKYLCKEKGQGHTGEREGNKEKRQYIDSQVGGSVLPSQPLKGWGRQSLPLTDQELWAHQGTSVSWVEWPQWDLASEAEGTEARVQWWGSHWAHLCPPPPSRTQEELNYYFQ